MNRRYPQRQNTRQEASFRFPTMAKLREAWLTLEKNDIWCRQSGKHLVVNSQDQGQVKSILEDLKEK